MSSRRYTVHSRRGAYIIVDQYVQVDEAGNLRIVQACASRATAEACAALLNRAEAEADALRREINSP